MDANNWQAEVERLLAENRKIEAIKVLRAARGCSLAEAKGEVDRLAAQNRASSDGVGANWEDQVLDLVQAGQKIAAIKLYRQHSGTGLKESKEFIEELEKSLGIESKPIGCMTTATLLFGVAAVVAWRVL